MTFLCCDFRLSRFEFMLNQKSSSSTVENDVGRFSTTALESKAVMWTQLCTKTKGVRKGGGVGVDPSHELDILPKRYYLHKGDW